MGLEHPGERAVTEKNLVLQVHEDHIIMILGPITFLLERQWMKSHSMEMPLQIPIIIIITIIIICVLYLLSPLLPN